jgi:hypothetical protein
MRVQAKKSQFRPWRVSILRKRLGYLGRVHAAARKAAPAGTMCRSFFWPLADANFRSLGSVRALLFAPRLTPECNVME